MKAQVQDTTPACAAGVYPVRFDDIAEQSNDQGKFWLWSFALWVPGSAILDTAQYGEEDTIIPLTATTSPRLTPRTKASKWLAGLGVDVEVGDEIDFEEVKGRTALGVVEVTEDNYSRIVAILPAPPEK